MIIIKKIQIKDFLSHENTSISFKDNEKLSIEGSSGSGKSSIVDAVIWALYGESRNDNRSVVRRGSKAATVSVELDDGNKTFIITRSTTDKAKNSLSCTESKDDGSFSHIERSGMKDIQSWIENDLLHASYGLFINSVAYPQDNINNFVRQTAAKRKDLLLEIMNAGDIDTYYGKTRDAISVKEISISAKMSSIDSNKAIIEKYRTAADKLPSYEAEYSVLSERIKKSEEDEKKVSEMKHSYQRALLTLSSIENSINTVSNNLIEAISKRDLDKADVDKYHIVDISESRRKISESISIKKEIESVSSEIDEETKKTLARNSYMANKPHVFDFSSEIEAINKQLIPMVKESHKCPSGDLCPFVLPIKRQIEFYTNQIAEKNELMDKSRKEYDKWLSGLEKLPLSKNIDELNTKLKLLKSSILDLPYHESIVNRHDQMEPMIKKLTENIESASKKIDELTAAKTSLENDRKNIKSVCDNLSLEISGLLKGTSSVDLLRNKRDEMISLIAIAKNAKTSIDTATSDINKIQKELKDEIRDVERLKLLKEAFSSRGIKTVVIDYIIPQLENRINEILSQLSDFKIHLETQRNSASGDGIIEGLFIEIFNERGELHDFSSYSGGEKLKIIVAISEALASMQRVGFRILDELFIGLDEDSTDSFANVMSKLQSKFKQILCISHLRSIKDVFDQKLIVTKINGISNVTRSKELSV